MSASFHDPAEVERMVEALLFAAAGPLSLEDLQRRLVNALQDLEVKYDGTVKETRGMIVQFQYGEDGVDASRRDYASGENVKRIIKSVLQKGPEESA